MKERASLVVVAVVALVGGGCSSTITPGPTVDAGHDGGGSGSSSSNGSSSGSGTSSQSTSSSSFTSSTSSSGSGTSSGSGSDAGFDATLPGDSGPLTDALFDAPVIITEFDGSAGPPREAGMPSTSNATHNLAIHHLYIGDTIAYDTTFTESATAWQAIGYDIDGIDTTSADATNVCTPYTHGQTVVDGDYGIDNAFGEVIIAMGLSELGMNLSQDVSGSITKGNFTLEIDTNGLTDQAMQTNTGLTGQLFGGGQYSGTPPLTGSSFSLSDQWPVTVTSLNDGQTIAGGAKVSFPESYIVNGTWVSGAPVTLSIPLTLVGAPLVLTIHHAILSFVYSVDAAMQGHATQGVISGVLVPSELIASFNEAVGQLNGGAECSVFSSTILPIIERSQDLVFDSSNGEVANIPGMSCNAISIGLAFDADEIAAPTVVASPADAGALLPPCAGN